MLQMLKTEKDEAADAPLPSAFSPPGKSPALSESLGRSPSHLSSLNSGNKRDSGYGTDFSPASTTSATNRFTFTDTEATEPCDVMDDIDSEVFEPSVSNVILEETESDDTSDDVDYDDDSSDDTDREVEELTGGGADDRHAVSQPILIQRPSAPIPTPEENGEETEREGTSDENEEGHMISHQFNHTRWSNMPRNKFRPIASRSVGTQTPSPTCQLIINATGNIPLPRLSRVRTIERLRMRSESGEVIPNALPDVIPMSRDRSVSLPDVPAFRRQEHEQVVGRELRRISDEFNSSFTPVRRTLFLVALVLAWINVVVTIVLNLTVIIIICSYEKRSRLYFFLLNLAIADLAGGVLDALPHALERSLGLEHVVSVWVGGNVLCKIQRTVAQTCLTTSNYILAAMSVDRAYVICKPLLNMKRGSILQKATVVCCWLLCLLCSSPSLKYYETRNYQEIYSFSSKQQCIYNFGSDLSGIRRAYKIDRSVFEVWSHVYRPTSDNYCQLHHVGKVYLPPVTQSITR